MIASGSPGDRASRFRTSLIPSDIATAATEQAHRAEFGREHDHFRLVGQDNLRRYRAVPALRVRVHPDDTAFEIFARVVAARTVGCRITVSVPPRLASDVVAKLDRLTASWAADIEFVEEDDARLAALIGSVMVVPDLGKPIRNVGTG